MPESISEVFEEISNLLFKQRSIVIDTNVFAIIVAIIFLIFLIINNIKYFSESKNRKLTVKFNTEHEKIDPNCAIVIKKGNEKKLWYPSGWKWNEEKQLWEAPDFIKNDSADQTKE